MRSGFSVYTSLIKVVSNSLSFVIVIPATPSVLMFSSISASVIVKRPLARVSAVAIRRFSDFDSSVCSATVYGKDQNLTVAASLAPTVGSAMFFCQPMMSALSIALISSRFEVRSDRLTT